MNHSATIGALAAALAKAQKHIKGALKDSTNPFYKSSYADLASVQDAIRDPLSDNELAVIQGASSEAARVTVTTLIAHSSGEWISSSLSATAKDESPQSLGSCVSYLRRYGISSLVGVAQVDDDGESAQPRPAQKYPVKGIEAAKDLIVAHKNIEAAKATLAADPLDERRRALWTRLTKLGMPAGAAADWVKTNRASPPGGSLTAQDFTRMEEMLAGIEKDAAVKDDIQF